MMSSLPSPAKVAGTYMSLYETYYSLVDPGNHGQIEAMDAAKFLKKSHLSDTILSKIWDIADPDSRGFLDKAGMFVALKLCALAQQGHNLSIGNIYLDVLPPKMGETLSNIIITCCPQSTNLPISNNSWTINSSERTKYEQLFQSLEPINGLIPGNKVKGVLMDSNLPLEILGKIWDLADIDKDGKLNQHEFIVAMHLVYKALEKKTVPNTLPIELLNSNNVYVEDLTSKLQFSVIPATELITSNIPSSILIKDRNTTKWVVSNEDQKVSDKLFLQADEDMDGFVSGAEIKDVFIQSGLSQAVLARIWNLCDITKNGMLNNEQFALAMHLIKLKINGIDLPNVLTAEMFPPSLKKKHAEYVIENDNICSYSNSELDMISKDITKIIREKLTMEQDISQKEADIKIKTGEIKSLQSELDTLAATLKQLDNQKGEAQKRLYDLKTQVDKLRQQAVDQESALQIQEDELNNKRQEIEYLKLAEHNLEIRQQEHKNNLNCLTMQLQNIQLKISQTKANLTLLEEQQHQVIDAMTQYDTAFTTGDGFIVPDSSLLFKANLEGAVYNLTTLNDFKNIENNNGNEKQISNNSEQRDFHSLTSICKNTYHPEHHSFQTSFQLEPEKMKDPFGDDPFAALHAPTRAESPSPALPPKKSKQPPPRPAPPRPLQGPQEILRLSGSPPITSTITNTDPFNNSNSLNNTSSNTFEFADFAKFDQEPASVTADSNKYRLDEKIKMDQSILKKLPDFEEDPFLDYKYEDLSMLSDTFYDNVENFYISKFSEKETSTNLKTEDQMESTTN